MIESDIAATDFVFMDTILSDFRQRFDRLESSWASVLAAVPPDKLFFRPEGGGGDMTPFTVGEFVLRSAAMVERTFGGITTRLWDDPFEWTLPEKLYSVELITDYIAEVREVRNAGLDFIATDEALSREIPAPARLRSLAEILIAAVADAEHYNGRAFAVLQIVTGTKPPAR